MVVAGAWCVWNCSIFDSARNACGINPQDNMIYCTTRDLQPPNVQEQLVRIKCDIPPGWRQGDDPVLGEVCYLGKTSRSLDCSDSDMWHGQRQESLGYWLSLWANPGTFAAAFDPTTGDYYLRRDGGRPRGLIQRITYSTISSLTGSNSPLTTNIQIDDVLAKSGLEAWPN